MESQLTVLIPLPLAEKLEQVARELHRKRSDLVRMALEEFLGDPGQPLETHPDDRVQDAQAANPYPLRGQSIRYEDPTEPVAEGDWEALH
jgi:Arc/MetJ-type ribon-helix-helix transcriptional regulator